MAGYIVRRVLSGIAMMLALTFATFAVFSIIPFNPARIIIESTQTRPATAAQLRAADHKLGVDRPFYVQFAKFAERVVVHGQFGHSFQGESINKVLADSGPITLALLVGGALVVLLLAVPLGILSARRPDSKIDRAVLLFSIVGIALHPFVVGTLLRHWLGHDLGVLPNGGYCPFHSVPPQTLEQSFGQELPSCHGAPVLWMWLSHMLLPWLTIALFFLPFYVRLIRARLIETYSEPFVLTARAKGASETRIFARHALRFVAGSIVTIAAFDIGAGITGAMYVEFVFHLPGLGSQALQALGTSPAEPGYDLPIMTGIVVAVACAVVLLSLAADVLASWLDPRIRLTRNSA